MGGFGGSTPGVLDGGIVPGVSVPVLSGSGVSSRTGVMFVDGIGMTTFGDAIDVGGVLDVARGLGVPRTIGLLKMMPK